ncbi:MAG TPA: hypothetical protein VF118_07540 [Gemmatimonadaceae bacterium]
MTLELIYFRGCPHAAQARANVHAALAASGVEVAVREWDRDDAAAPPHVREYASPTVLVNGRDVSGASPSSDSPACRLGGAPSMQAILRAIESR